MTRSDSCISAIFASTALSSSVLRTSDFNSLARSLIAARSSSVKPFFVLTETSSYELGRSSYTF